MQIEHTLSTNVHTTAVGILITQASQLHLLSQNEHNIIFTMSYNAVIGNSIISVNNFVVVYRLKFTSDSVTMHGVI